MTPQNQYALSSNETVNIIAIGDFHIGSSEFNYEFFDYMLKQIKKLKNRRIYLMGDLLESASKSVGNHEARLIKEFDFNVVADIARELGCKWYNQNIDTFKIN